MLIKDLLNFCRKLFSGRFINAVHFAIIAEQNDMQRVLYPLSVSVAPSIDRETLFFFFLKRKTYVDV